MTFPSRIARQVPTAFAAVFSLVSVACNTQPPASSTGSSEARLAAPPSSAVPASTPSAPTAAPTTFGKPISSNEKVSLSDVAKHPADFKGKTIVTTGKVAAVCQERGCWMEIKDGAGDANVRMHGHAFFVPTTSQGKMARIEGTVMLVKDGKECDEMAATGATLQFDATGVELM